MISLALDLADLIRVIVLQGHAPVGAVGFGLEAITFLLVFGLTLDLGGEKATGGECKSQGGL